MMHVQNPTGSNELDPADEAPESVRESGEFALSEDQALAQLKNRDLSSEQIEELIRNRALLKSRKVRFALAAHAHTPRQLALRLIRELYTFDLMRLSLTPAVAADLKRLAEELLASRLSSITLGERLSLARRASSFVAAALLLDKESAVWQAALQNPRLTEAAIVKALHALGSSPRFVEAVCHHEKWSVRHEVRVALLRNPHTSRLPEKTKAYLRSAVLGGKNARGAEVGTQNSELRSWKLHVRSYESGLRR
jgi:hypothetical protein